MLASTVVEPGLPEILRGETPLSILFLLFLLPAMFVLASALAAVAVRLSAQILGYGMPTFFNAGVCTLINYGIQFGIGLSLGFVAGAFTSMHQHDQVWNTPYSIAPLSSPLIILAIVTQGLFMSGLVFSKVLRVDSGASRLLYWDSFLLAALTNALLGGFLWVVVMLISFMFALTA